MFHPRKPLSAKQLAANRANAAHSTGPHTTQGKARSAQNARKHDFTASNLIGLRPEEVDEVARLTSGRFVDCLQHTLSGGFQIMVRASNSWSLFLRYQARAERNYRRAVEEFERLTALRPGSRPKLPNEPIVEAEPKQNKPDASPETNPLPSAGGQASACGPISIGPPARPSAAESTRKTSHGLML